MSVGFTYSTPILCVNDLAASLVHYVEVLGFLVQWKWSAEQAFDEAAAPTFACVQRGEVALFLCHQGQGQPGAWLSLHLASLEDVAAIHAELVAAGATISEPPADRPWGMREMHVQDLDGNTFRIGAPLSSSCEPEEEAR